MDKANSIDEQFIREIGRHVMEVIRDEGVHRHIRFRRPGTMCMHFDLITWPGYLCYTGDMGTFVFSRLRDMFEFFRHDKPNLSYWAEKLQASDRSDGFDEFSADEFRKAVLRRVDEYFDDELVPGEKEELLEAVNDEVLENLEWRGEHAAFQALHDFEFKGFRFDDWESQCRGYSHRFKWCCHALVWAIETYDSAAAATPPPADLQAAPVAEAIRLDSEDRAAPAGGAI